MALKFGFDMFVHEKILKQNLVFEKRRCMCTGERCKKIFQLLNKQKGVLNTNKEIYIILGSCVERQKYEML